jgi:transcriptional regulator of heat shock response
MNPKREAHLKKQRDEREALTIRFAQLQILHKEAMAELRKARKSYNRAEKELFQVGWKLADRLDAHLVFLDGEANIIKDNKQLDIEEELTRIIDSKADTAFIETD